MKLDCVLTATDNNPLYVDFIPIFIKSWKKLYPYVDIKIIFINNDIPQHLIEYKDNLILFEPIEGIMTSFIAQFIRLLYPCILDEYKNGVMITDMDMLPMSSTYYTENIKNFSDDKFIYYREACLYDYHQIAMCYNIGLPSVWREIFEISNLNDIRELLKNIYSTIEYNGIPGQKGWSTDQIYLYKKVFKWSKNSNRFVIMKDKNTGFKRLDRGTFTLSLNDTLINNIISEVYTDYHALRPYLKYKEVNDKIVDLLPLKN